MSAFCSIQWCKWSKWLPIIHLGEISHFPTVPAFRRVAYISYYLLTDSGTHPNSPITSLSQLIQLVALVIFSL